MSHARLHLHVACALIPYLVGASAGYAQELGSSRDANNPPRMMRPFDRPGNGERPWGFRRGDVSPEEWQVISEFMQENFPNRWAVYQQVSSTPGREMLARELRRRIAIRYRQLERIRQDNESLYDVTLQQAKAEDQVWGTVRAWRELSEKASDSERTSVLEKLQSEVRALLERNFKERETRLNNIRQALEREQKQLDEDRQRIDDMVEARVQTLTSDNPFRGPDTMNPAPPQGPRAIERDRLTSPSDEARPGPGPRRERSRDEQPHPAPKHE